MKYLAMALASAALTGAQTPAISIQPNMAGLAGPAVAANGPHTGVPALGYLIGPGPLDLRLLIGTAKTARLGGAVALPKGVKRFFLPPRERYLLLESAASDPVAVWSPVKGASEAVPITGAMPHPDMVAFSARGDAFVIYSSGSGGLQVVSGLPAQPSAVALPALERPEGLASFALSDDGTLVAAQLTDGTVLLSSHGAAWQRLPIAFGARVLLFVSRTHNLAISDTSQQTVSLIANVEDNAPVARILAQGVAADHLASTKDGDMLLAASSSQNKLWTIDLKTMTAEPGPSAAIDTLIPLRDGRTFLTSASGVSLLNIPAEGDTVFELVPVTR